MITTHCLNWGEGIIELRLCNLSAWLLPATHHSLCSCCTCCTSTGSKKGSKCFTPSGAGTSSLGHVPAAHFSLPICGWRILLWQLGWREEWETTCRCWKAESSKAAWAIGASEDMDIWGEHMHFFLWSLSSSDPAAACSVKHRGNK